MSFEKIHKLFLSNRLLLFTIVIAFVAVRLYSEYSHWDNLSLWGSLLVQIVIAFSLLKINDTFNIIQIRTFLPVIFYLLFTGINPVFYYDLKGSIAAFCFVLCYHCLFVSYQKPESQINALNISLLLVLGSLLWSPLLFLFPVFWRGFHHFQCFNTRMFFANLTGFVIVYLFIFSLSIFQGDANIFFTLLPKPDILLVFQKPDFTTLEWLVLGCLLITFLIIGLYLYIIDISERVWSITTLKYFYFTAFVSLIFLFVQSEYKSTWGLIAYIPISFLCGHAFSRLNKRGIQYLLLLLFLFFFGIGIAQHIGT